MNLGCQIFEDFLLSENKKLLSEGGIGGHIPHPHEMVQNGEEFINLFHSSVNGIKEKNATMKIDGINTSIRLVDNQFVLDRGTKHELDVLGVGAMDVNKRFKSSDSNIISAASTTLKIFNEALPLIQEELKTLGFLENPRLIFNTEFVEESNNRAIKYSKKFIVIHSVLEMHTEHNSNKDITSRAANRIYFDDSVLNSLVKKVSPIAQKYGFFIFTKIVPHLKKTPNIEEVLNRKFVINFSKNKQTKTLKQWLLDINKVPEKMIQQKDFIYFLRNMKTSSVDNLFQKDEIYEKVNGIVLYYATIVLGDEILKSIDSDVGMGVNNEGIVIQDNNISIYPYKITGKFFITNLGNNPDI